MNWLGVIPLIFIHNLQILGFELLRSSLLRIRASVASKEALVVFISMHGYY